MLKRLHRKQPTRREKILQEIKYYDDEINVNHQRAKEFGEKEATGKALQCETRASIMVDKRAMLYRELDSLGESLEMSQEERIKIFSDDTMRFYTEWAVEHDRGYITYLKIIEKSPQVLEEILKIPIENVKDLDKIPEYVLSRKSE